MIQGKHMFQNTRMLRALAVAALATASAGASANDFPTADRVAYVEACMHEHPGATHYEALNKCSCALDFLARDLPYDDYVELSTAALAVTIGGERGSTVRDAPGVQADVKKFKQLQAAALKSCFIQ